MESIAIIIYAMVALGFFLGGLRWAHQERELDVLGGVIVLVSALFWPVLVGIFTFRDYLNTPF